MLDQLFQSNECGFRKRIEKKLKELKQILAENSSYNTSFSNNHNPHINNNTNNSNNNASIESSNPIYSNIVELSSCVMMENVPVLSMLKMKLLFIILYSFCVTFFCM